MRSGVSGKTGAIAVVSLLKGRKSVFTHHFPILALYEADKQAHEEAVQNGGVSNAFFLMSSAQLFEHIKLTWLNSFGSLSCIGTALHIPRRASTSPPASGNLARTPSQHILVRTTSSRCALRRRRMSVMSSSGIACARSQGRAHCRCCHLGMVWSENE